MGIYSKQTNFIKEAENIVKKERVGLKQGQGLENRSCKVWTLQARGVGAVIITFLLQILLENFCFPPGMLFFGSHKQGDNPQGHLFKPDLFKPGCFHDICKGTRAGEV